MADIRSPLLCFDSQFEWHDDYFNLIKKQRDSNNKAFRRCYDLYSNSAMTILKAMKEELADEYIFNSECSPFVIFWQHVKDSPNELIAYYNELCSAYENQADKSDFYLSIRQYFNENTDDEKKPAAFAFLINHAKDYKLKFSNDEKLSCDWCGAEDAAIYNPHASSQAFAKAVHSVHVLFKKNEQKIKYTNLKLPSCLDEITNEDLVILTPPYWEYLSGDDENIKLVNDYSLRQKHCELHKDLTSFINSSANQSSFVLFYWMLGIENEYSLKWPVGHVTRLSRYKNNPAKEYPEHLYLSESLANILVKHPEVYQQQIQPCFHRVFESQVIYNKNNPALIWEGQTITYDELNKYSNALANHLLNKGVKKSPLVIIYLERGPQLIISILAALKAGAAFLPLDAGIDRLSREAAYERIKQCKAEFIITHSDIKQALEKEALQQRDEWTPTKIIVEENDIRFENLLVEMSEDSKNNLNLPINPDQLAYVMYTSGSTGNPKGVEILHQGLAYAFMSHVDIANISRLDRIAQFASIGFDASIMEIMVALSCGAQLHLANDIVYRDIKNLDLFYKKNEITIIIQTPRLLEKLNPAEFNKIRVVFIVGESFDKKLSDKWLTFIKQVINGYGLTETTICSTLEECSLDELLTIGKTILGLIESVVKLGAEEKEDLKSQLENQGKDKNVLESDNVGELVYSGPCVARGYLNNPELTEKKFTNGYQTGDVVKRLSNGKLQYIRRKDNQIKLRGQRLEPELIENEIKLYEIDGKKLIENVCVVSQEKIKDQIHLSAFIEVSALKNCSEADKLLFKNKARKFLKTKLPAYMVPNAWGIVDELPKSKNNKINRHELRERPIPFLKTNLTDSLLTIHEKQLAEIWKNILPFEIGEIKRNDDFFCLGGNSLLVTSLLQALSANSLLFKKASNLKPIDIYECSDIKTMARCATASPLLKLYESDKPLATVIFVHSILGDGSVEYDVFSNEFQKNHLSCKAYALRAPALSISGDSDRDIKELAEYYVHISTYTKKIHKKFPVILVGWSSGGIIATEMATQLTAQGYTTSLVMIDTTKHQLEDRAEVEKLLDEKVGKGELEARKRAFAQWLFFLECEYSPKVEPPLLNRTMLIYTSQSKDKNNLFLFDGIKNKNEVSNVNHFNILQSNKCRTLLNEFCDEIIHEEMTKDLIEQFKHYYKKAVPIRQFLSESEFWHLDDKYIPVNLVRANQDQPKTTTSFIPKKSNVSLSKLASIENERILVQGASGSGKTLLTLHLVQQWARESLWHNHQTVKCVIRVILKNLPKDDKNVLDLTDVVRFSHKEMDFNSQNLKALISRLKDNILWILDGFDEVAHHLDKNSALGRILKILLSQKKVIVTARPEYNEKLPNFLPLSNAGFSDSSIYRYFSQRTVTQQKKRILDSSVSFALFKTPILLELLCLLAKEDNFPSDLSTFKLYYLVVEKFKQYYWQKLNEGRNEKLFLIPWQEPIHVLETAFYCLKMAAFTALKDGDKGNIQGSLIVLVCDMVVKKRNQEIQQVVLPSFFPKENLSIRIDDVISYIIHSGFLSEMSKGDKIESTAYEFVHASFQEYLSCCYVIELIKNNITEDNNYISCVLGTNLLIYSEFFHEILVELMIGEGLGHLLDLYYDWLLESGCKVEGHGFQLNQFIFNFSEKYKIELTANRRHRLIDLIIFQYKNVFQANIFYSLFMKLDKEYLSESVVYFVQKSISKEMILEDLVKIGNPIIDEVVLSYVRNMPHLREMTAIDFNNRGWRKNYQKNYKGALDDFQISLRLDSRSSPYIFYKSKRLSLKTDSIEANKNNEDLYKKSYLLSSKSISDSDTLIPMQAPDYYYHGKMLETGRGTESNRALAREFYIKTLLCSDDLDSNCTRKAMNRLFGTTPVADQIWYEVNKKIRYVSGKELEEIFTDLIKINIKNSKAVQKILGENLTIFIDKAYEIVYEWYYGQLKIRSTIALCSVVLILEPNNLNARLLRANALRFFGEKKAALEDISYLEAISPENLAVVRLKQVIEFEMGNKIINNIDTTWLNYKEELDINVFIWSAIIMYACFNLNKEAMEYIDYGLSRFVKPLDILRLLNIKIIILRKLHNLENAEKILDELLEKFSEFSVANYIYYKEKQNNNAYYLMNNDLAQEYCKKGAEFFKKNKHECSSMAEDFLDETTLTIKLFDEKLNDPLYSAAEMVDLHKYDKAPAVLVELKKFSTNCNIYGMLVVCYSKLNYHDKAIECGIIIFTLVHDRDNRCDKIWFSHFIHSLKKVGSIENYLLLKLTIYERKMLYNALKENQYKDSAQLFAIWNAEFREEEILERLYMYAKVNNQVAKFIKECANVPELAVRANAILYKLNKRKRADDSLFRLSLFNFNQPEDDTHGFKFNFSSS